MFNRLVFHVLTLALIQLRYRIEFSAHIQPVRMPTACNAPQHGTAIVMGYGGSTSWLQYAVLHIRQYDIYCNVYKGIEWDDSRICAFDHISHQSTCHGDSGSPLVTLSDNTLVGILNFGPSGKTVLKSFHFRNQSIQLILFIDRHNLLGFPEAYASVPYHLKWIKNTTGLSLVDC